MAIDIEDFEDAIAERFGHVLRNDAPTIAPASPRALARLFAARLRPTTSRVSVVARAFYRVRAALAAELGIAPHLICPGTRCRDLMPELSLRRAQWTRVCDSLRLRQAPRLVRSDRLAWALTIVGGVFTLLAALVVAVSLPSALIVPATALAGGGFAAVALRLTRHRANHFVPRDLTVASLVWHLVAYGSPILGDADIPATESQTLEVIQALVRLEIGAPLVDPDATWGDLVSLARAS